MKTSLCRLKDVPHARLTNALDYRLTELHRTGTVRFRINLRELYSMIRPIKWSLIFVEDMTALTNIHFRIDLFLADYWTDMHAEIIQVDI